MESIAKNILIELAEILRNEDYSDNEAILMIQNRLGSDEEILLNRYLNLLNVHNNHGNIITDARKHIDGYGDFLIRNNKGGGDCFYESCSNGLVGHPNTKSILRLGVFSKIMEHLESFGNLCDADMIEDESGLGSIKNIRKLLCNICISGNWATNAAVYGMVLFLNRNLIVYSNNGSGYFAHSYNAQRQTLPPIILERTEIEDREENRKKFAHYQTLFVLKDDQDLMIRDKKKCLKQNVEDIMENYANVDLNAENREEIGSLTISENFLETECNNDIGEVNVNNSKTVSIFIIVLGYRKH